jgi:hypothetical protein
MTTQGETTMKAAFVICVLALLPTIAAADYVATEEEMVAMRTHIAKNPPTAKTLTAQPYPGATLDVVRSGDQSAERQPRMMVYCFYTHDSIDKVQAHLDGPGKPDATVYARADRGSVVDTRGRVTIRDITQISYYVDLAPPTAKKPAAAASAAATAPTPVIDATPAAAAPAVAQPTQEPVVTKPEDDSASVQKAVEQGKKLKGLLGF